MTSMRRSSILYGEGDDPNRSKYSKEIWMGRKR